MHLTPDVEKWLQDAGYESHCFVSWAHTGSKEMKQCAEKVRDAIEEELRNLIDRPKVSLDEDVIAKGANWPIALAQALCRSLTMVAICAPIYYHESHRLCGQEWAAMDKLGQTRLFGVSLTPIIPLIYRMSASLPPPVSRIQYIDISRVSVCGRRYFKTQEFRKKIQQIVEQIERIALTVMRNQSRADCEQYQLPSESAFLNYQISSQPFPLRSSNEHV